jgi:hypothetical protein
VPYIPLEVFANQATTAVSAGGTTAPAQGTVETWTVVSSGLFPAIGRNATQFHVADTAATSEIVTVLAVSGTTWTVQRGAEGSTPVTHITGFTVVQVVTAGALSAGQYPPWQFPVTAYGAVGDGKIGTGGTGASGQAVFTDAAASFVNATAPAGDVGKYIIANQGAGGSATSPFCGTIIAVNSPTSITLSANLAATCASAPYIYGTDDTAAINAAVAAAAAWATATGNYKAQVMFEPQNYVLGGLTQSTSPYYYNTQIPVPVGAQYGRKLVIDFIGVGDASEPDYWESTVPNLQGTCLVSALFGTAQPNGTYGPQSVIGGPTGTTGMTVTGVGAPGGFANTLLNIQGITVVCPWNAQQRGVDAAFLAQMNIPNASYLAFAPVNYNAQTCGGPYLSSTNLVSNGQSFGFFFPGFGNNDNCNVGQLTAEGAYYGVAISEHFTAQRLAMIYVNAGVYLQNINGGQHGATIDYLSCEASNWVVYCYNSTGVAAFPITVGSIDVEVMNTGIVYDPVNTLCGTMYVETTAAYPVVTGASNVELINVGTPRGVAGPPAVPATTVAFQSNYWRHATVYVTWVAGTVTIAVGGHLTGQSLSAAGTAAVRVPSGSTITLTYASTAPTWVWILD